MEKDKYAHLSNEDLLAELDKHKPSKVFSSFGIGLLFGVTIIDLAEAFEQICFIIYIVIRHVLTTNLVEIIQKFQNKMNKKIMPKD